MNENPNNKYIIMWQEGRLPMQLLAKILMEKGISPKDFDYTSHKKMSFVVKYNQNILYRIYRNVITFPRQCLIKSAKIFCGILHHL